MKISTLFEDEPKRWGLRGDPHLWRELKEKLKLVEMPATPESLKLIIESEFEKATGSPVSSKDSIFIERFRNGGMSSGRVSPQFWVEHGIPLLVSRHLEEEPKGEYPG